MGRQSNLSDEVKLQAIADLEARPETGETGEEIAQRYGVTPKTLYAWKRNFDERGEPADDPDDDEAPSAAPPPAAAPADDDGDDDDEEEEEEEKEQDEMGYESGEPRSDGAFVLHTGTVLPPYPAQPESANKTTHRVYPDAFKYRIARACSRREAAIMDVVRYYGVDRKSIHAWIEAMKEQRLKKPPKSNRPPPPPPAPQTNGVARQQTLPSVETRQVHAPPPQTLHVANVSPPATIMRAPPEAQLVHATPMLAELQRLEADKARLEAENAKLKRRLAEALEMAKQSMEARTRLMLEDHEL